MRWIFYLTAVSGILVAVALVVLDLAGSFKGQGLSADVWVALLFGVFFTSALGIGLMALIFDSDHEKIDDQAYRITWRMNKSP